MLSHFKPAALMLLAMTILTGLIYPAIVTAIAQTLFSEPANGSLITDASGKALGSRLIGQPFSDPKYFWGRPSATAPFPYNAGASSGSNQGPTNPALVEAVTARVQTLRDTDPGTSTAIPVDLVTASGSGLDPHISPAAAEFQVDRVARARQLPTARVWELVAQHTEGRTGGILGEPRVNVLILNRAVDELK